MLSPTCCSFYSFTGIIFMLFVYIMLATQPFFITGLPDIDLARKNAFGALMTFCTTFALSVFLIMKDSKAASGKETTDCWGGDHDGTHELGSPNLMVSGAGKQSYGAVTTDSY
mmetsp:Transcript_13770/g.20526  ORF Transcript_13770/g.20526 Transcript_13770/m.20526 type:complete len:113 (-) Transcript_13770:297-635(-)